MYKNGSRAIVATLTLSLALAVGANSVVAQRGGGAAPPDQTGPEVTIRRPFSNAPELIVRHGVPQGTLHRFTMKSEDSKIYKGIARDKPGAVVPYAQVGS